MSAVDQRSDENSSISSSSASSTFSPGEEDIPPFLTDQRGHLQAAKTYNLQSDTEQICENKRQTPTLSSDGESANLSSSEFERRRRIQPCIENGSCCSESDLESGRLCPKNQFYESYANEAQSNVADSDSILSGNNKANSGMQMSATLFSGIGHSGSTQGSRKCSLTESRPTPATRINSSVISSRLFNPETLDSSVMTSQ